MARKAALAQAERAVYRHAADNGRILRTFGSAAYLKQNEGKKMTSIVMMMEALRQEL